MKKLILIVAFALAAIGIGMVAANATPSQGTTDGFTYCVHFGSGSNATGNVMLNDWNNTPCPAGTYPHHLKVQDVDPFLAPNFYLDSSSVNPTQSTSGIAFRITDFATNPVTVWDCGYTAPKADGTAPGIVCTKH